MDAALSFGYVAVALAMSNLFQEVLFDAGYVPSNSKMYPSGAIIAAIENALHTTLQLVCLKGALEEIRLCLTKDFKFRDCVAASDCPEYVSLPAFASLGKLTHI
ncbi:putative ribonuclease T(2) [Helianthus anomalus]